MNKQKLPGIKINITERPKVVEKTLGFKQIYENRDLFKKLSFQIDLDEDKINDMIERYKRNKDYLIFKNKIVIGVVSKNFKENQTLYVVDGQHRIELAIRLYQQYDIMDTLIFCYYEIKNDSKMRKLFKETNLDSLKNNNYINLPEFQESIYDSLKEYLKKNYSFYFSEHKSIKTYRYSITEFMEILLDKKYFDKIKSLNKAIEDIENKNKKFSNFVGYPEIVSKEPRIFYKQEQICATGQIIMCLKNNNFIDYLLESTNTCTVIPKHIFKNKKKKISPKLRKQVWEKEFSENNKGVCPIYYCNNDINNGPDGFHCGYIISEFNGGITSIKNLRPICSECDSCMGKSDWDNYENKCKKIDLV